MAEEALARFLSAPLLRHMYSTGATIAPVPGMRAPVGRMLPLVRDAWRRCTEDYHLSPEVRLYAAVDVDHALSAAWAEGCPAESPVGRVMPGRPDAVNPDIPERARAALTSMVDVAVTALQSSGVVLMLADANGVLFHVKELGLPPYPETQGVIGRGAIWNERVIGNNGLGSAAALRRPLAFQGKEHLCTDLHGFGTAGYPILALDGSVLAVLGAITDRLEATGLLLSTLRLGGKLLGAQLVDALLGEQAHSGWIIYMRATDITPDLDVSAAFFRGTLVIDQKGCVRGADEPAVKLLDCEHPEQLIGQTLETLLGVGLYTVIGRMGHEDCVFGLRSARGRNLVIEAVSPANPAEEEDRIMAYVVPASGYRQNVPSPPAALEPKDKTDSGDRVIERLIPKLLALQERKIPMLITGESGVGKNYLVQRMHAQGPRKHGPVVTVNCAAIPRELIQAELFGYEPGSFTGAHAKGRIGKVQAADKGILFLNEIGDMPLELQTSLLQLMDTSEVTPIGGTRPIAIDILVVATTNRPLREDIRNGRFRLDLYHRLAGIEIELPPLRERDDKEWLIQKLFETELASLGHGHEKQLGRDAISILLQHPWPGNVRQLRHTIRLILASACGPVIHVSDLPQKLLEEMDNKPQPTPAGGSADLPAPDAGGANALCQWERQAVRAALARADGNISEAARRLGVTRTTLYRKMHRYGLRSGHMTSS
jgi:transcriptional regulator of acetoin/glycerol metabolism